jgi:catechol 2,3-dioxygenase-like lactoylglutathione lyase family enzyme
MPLLDHVGIKVTDLERSVRFYRDVFGFEEVDRRRFDDGVDAVGLRVGPNLLFLLHRPHYQSRDPKDVAGTDHFAISFDAAEWELITARVRELGVPIVQEQPVVLGATGRGPCQYILDPDGIEIEIKRA